MLVEAKCFVNEEEAKSCVFESGLYEAESDLSISATEPDMDISLIEGIKITIEVTENPEYQQRLEFISRGFNISRNKAATIVFLLGLFEEYLRLKYCGLYKDDPAFRKKVDEMPHDGCYDEDEMFKENS